MIKYIIGGIVLLVVLYILLSSSTSSPCTGAAPSCYVDGTLAAAAAATCNTTSKSWECPSGSCALTSDQYNTYSGIKSNTTGTSFTCKDAYGKPNVYCGGQVYTNDVVSPTSCGGTPPPDPRTYCGSNKACFDEDGTFKCVPYCSTNNTWGCYMTGDNWDSLSKTMGSKLSCGGGNWDSMCGTTSMIYNTNGFSTMNYDDPWTCTDGAWVQ